MRERIDMIIEGYKLDIIFIREYKLVTPKSISIGIEKGIDSYYIEIQVEQEGYSLKVRDKGTALTVLMSMLQLLPSN